jgi:hypothetical protein
MGALARVSKPLVLALREHVDPTTPDFELCFCLGSTQVLTMGQGRALLAALTDAPEVYTREEVLDVVSDALVIHPGDKRLQDIAGRLADKLRQRQG